MTTESQLSKDDLQAMYAKKQYAEIDEARKAGRYDVLLGREPKPELPEPGKQWSADDLHKAWDAKLINEIAEARERGDLSNVASGVDVSGE
jgi:hypothetical protein